MTENEIPPLSVAAMAQADQLSAELLQSVVDVARAIFGAAASSMFILDEESDELVFQAVSGQGAGTLVGRRFPASSGIAGWVVASGEPMVVNDLAGSRSFDRDLAESTEYVPDALMAAPLVYGGRILGVIEVLDPATQARSDLDELDLLALFARQAATALRVVVDRNPRATVLDSGGQTAARDLMASLQRLLETSAA
jgi:GAF domain-containing protein